MSRQEEGEQIYEKEKEQERLKKKKNQIGKKPNHGFSFNKNYIPNSGGLEQKPISLTRSQQ